MALFELAAQNLLTPMALFFALGLVAAFIRSDLSVPEAIAKGMALYLMLAIGFKGGVQMGDGGAGLDAGATILVAIALSFALPLIAFPLVRMLAKLPRADAAAIAGCYGSISIVTFVAATQMLGDGGANYEGYLVAAAAAMEAPAILTALWLYATLRGIGSARELDRRCGEKGEVPFQWICGGVSVNYHTLSDFRTQHAEWLDGVLLVRRRTDHPAVDRGARGHAHLGRGG